MVDITKAVIPAAGLGTRFLPITRVIPKELLPVIDRASIQYVVEEAVRSGIEKLIIVISKDKESIKNYLDDDHYINIGATRGKQYIRSPEIKRLSELAELIYVYQDDQLGLGHAVLCCSEEVGEEPFAVLLPDDIIYSDIGVTSQLLDAHKKTGTSIFAVHEVERDLVPNYGIIAPGESSNGIISVKGVVEKPRLHDAPSNLGIVGRYILTPKIFDSLRKLTPGVLGELQLTDGLASLIDSEGVHALVFEGARYDVGNPVSLLKASVELALKREDIGQDFLEFLRQVISDL